MGILSANRSLWSIVTRRSLVPPPSDPDDERWQESFRYLFETYYPALVRYVDQLLRRWTGRASAERDAEDIVQSYLVACMEKGWLSSEEELRSFRHWIARQLRRFTAKWLDRVRAKKRHPEKPFVGDEALHGLESTRIPEAEEALSMGMVEVALQRAQETLRRSNVDYYHVIRDLLATQGEGSADLAELLDRSPTAVNKLRQRARNRFARLFWAEVRQTVRDDDEEEFELLQTQLEPYLP